MGYYIDFTGSFRLKPKLRLEHRLYLEQFSDIRHTAKIVEAIQELPDPLREAVGLPIGMQGAFYLGTEARKSKMTTTKELNSPIILDPNTPPSGQPSLYCQWMPSPNGNAIVWDGGEKFYYYIEWLEYLIGHFLKPWGYSITGMVRWEGDEYTDCGFIIAKNNDLTIFSGCGIVENGEDIRPMRVFLCHASADKPKVRKLYDRLARDGLNPWLDEMSLLPGQDWELEIKKALRQSDVVLVCLTSHSITKAGFVQKEIKQSLDLADEQPEGSVFLIPVQLERCEVPERLKRWQWVDLFKRGGYGRLLLSLGARADHLSKK